MAVVTQYPTTDTAVSGVWVNPTNVQADDGAVAVTTIAAKSTTVNRQQGGYGFDSAIPSGSKIDQVDIEVEHRVSTNGGIAFLANAAGISGTLGAVNEDALEPTVLTARAYTSYARPGGGAWTRADLLDAVFGTIIRARSGNSATSVDYEWDYIRVKVTYTPPHTVAVAQATEADSAQAVGARKTVAAAQTTESDSAQTIGSIKTASVAQASEADVSQPASAMKIAVILAASEVDSVGAVTANKAQLAGQAIETDSALSITAFVQAMFSYLLTIARRRGKR